ncbi:hypothetical protein [Rhizosaccharibacter radicis]|uniref:Uncharacterized protein n=1 Tax=Rhizosaccharibacter radicis TaxID=2782605 RepID=A0ABT1VVL0_9PROT|nr:hypothetical protein [Acetobacteraceae bacterium KSS12]
MSIKIVLRLLKEFIDYFASFITPAAAVFAVIYARDAYLEAKNQSETAKSALVADYRPWLAVKSSLDEFIVLDEAGSVMISTKSIVVNHGHAPALSSKVSYDAVLGPFTDDQRHEALSSLCSRQKKQFSSKSVTVVFPDETVDLSDNNNPATISGLEVIQKHHQQEYLMNNLLRLPDEPHMTLASGTEIIDLVGCITYEFSGSSELHQTGFIYGVRQRLSGKEGLAFGNQQVINPMDNSQTTEWTSPDIQTKIPGKIENSKLTLEQENSGSIAN